MISILKHGLGEENVFTNFGCVWIVSANLIKFDII